MKIEPNRVELVKRQVIEKKLLAALDDKRKVAILCAEEDLDHLIIALDLLASEWSRDYVQSLRQLRREAFGK